MDRSIVPYGLGVVTAGENVYLYFNSFKDGNSEFALDISPDGLNFNPADEKPEMIDFKKRPQNTLLTHEYRISRHEGKYIMTYKLISETKPDLRIAESTDLIHWMKKSPVEGIKETGQIVPELRVDGKAVMIFGDHNLHIAYSDDLENWKANETPILSPRTQGYDDGPLSPALVTLTDEGIEVIYYVRGSCGKADCWSLGKAVLDKTNPARVISRSPAAILEHVEGFNDKNVRPVGVVKKGGMIVSFWDVDNEGIIAISHPLHETPDKLHKKTLKVVLEKLSHNPILKPITSHFWESKAVFNPAAIYDSGKVHLIYRAVGDNDVSVLGYATSSDGVTIDERLDEPIYVPRKHFEMNMGSVIDPTSAHISPYFSGGAYGGCEDPRIAKIGDEMVMMYVAYDGGSPPRVAMSRISVDDFRNRNWNWSDPVLVSRPGVVDKNACVLSEKINGKYAVFHRIFPNILIDYVDSLDEFDGERVFLKGQYHIPPRERMWDSRKLGIGAPPILTDKGWLLIYQAVDDRDASRYKMGAMLLKRDEPHVVLARSKHPILEPDQPYENEGMKYGVAYPCGAVEMDGMLNVYYGGADMVVCAAQAHLPTFLNNLTTHEEASLTPFTVKRR